MQNTRAAKSKKRTQKQGVRNRYHRRAKLSEYKFLKVLRCFCDEKTVNETSKATGISERTVRSMFARFREAMLRAALEDPYTLGWVGYFLFEKQEISRRGHAILDAVAGSDLMRWAIERHGARTGISKDKANANFSYLLFEVVARVFCTLSMKKSNDTLYSDEIHQAYAELQLVALYIDMHKDNPDDPELFRAVVTSFERIMKDFPKLLELEEYAHLVSGYAPHRFGANVLYEDLRRYLLKNPL